MACAITAGYVITCNDAVGGIDAIYLISYSEIDQTGGVPTMTEASGVITSIDKSAGKRFWKFDIPTKSAAVASSDPKGSPENGTLFFEQKIEFPINKRDATTRNIVTTMAKNRVIAVTIDKDGSYRMYGRYGGLFLDASTGSTGSAPGDANGYKLVFVGQEREDFFIVDSATALALETPGV